MDRDLAGGVVGLNPGDRLRLALREVGGADDLVGHELTGAAPRDLDGALDRVREVARLDGLAVREHEALAQGDRVDLAAVGDRRQRGCQARDQLRPGGSARVGVGQQAGVREPVGLEPPATYRRTAGRASRARVPNRYVIVPDLPVEVPLELDDDDDVAADDEELDEPPQAAMASTEVSARTATIAALMFLLTSPPPEGWSLRQI